MVTNSFGRLEISYWGSFLGDLMFKYIEDNPFRILGVYANSSKKDIVSSKGKIIAFTRIGRSVDFPNDFSNLIKSKVKRTSESVEKAESQLALPKDILKYAMFWFVKVTPLDNIALNHLCNGNIEMALSIWEKSDNVSSLQNRVVAYFINDQLGNSGYCAEKLYFEHREEFLSMVGCDTLKPSSYDLFDLFVECICEDSDTKYSILEIADNLESDDLKGKILSIPVEEYFKSIEQAVSKAESVKTSQGPTARLQAGLALKKEVEKYIHELCDLHVYDSLRFQVAIDKYANEVLQCGIDYYNDSDDIDAPLVALQLMEYACNTAIGVSQKNRCEENTSVVRNAANLLPPSNIISLIKEISKKLKDCNVRLNQFKNEVRTFNGQKEYMEPHVSCTRGAQLALDFLSDVRPLIIQLIGDDSNDAARFKIVLCCQDLFSDIVNFVINATIADVNSAWRDGVKSILLSKNVRLSTLLTIIFKNSWSSLQQVALLPLSSKENKDRLQKNIQSLKQIIDEFDGIMCDVDSSRNSFENPSYIFVDPMFFYGDEKYFNSCKSEYDFKRYLKLFPNGKYRYTAQQKIVQIETLRKNKEEADKKRQEEELRKKLEKIRIAAEQKARQEQHDNKVNNLASSATNVDMIAMALQACGKDSSESILDNKCFSLCRNKKDFKKYLSLFPSGKHRDAAQKKINDSGIPVEFFLIIIIIIIIGIVVGLGLGDSKSVNTNDTGTYIEDTVCYDTLESYDNLTGDVYGSSDNSYTSSNSVTSDDRSTSTNTTPEVDLEYEKYKDNQLRNGSQPYVDWYGYNSTFDEYDYHSEINITAPDATDVIVLVKKEDTNGAVVGHVYIRKGRKATIQISNGTRQVFFYYGNGWNPNKDMPGYVTGGFVSDESVSKDDPIYFNNNVLTYTLKSVVNGNFQTKRSNMSEAF